MFVARNENIEVKWTKNGYSGHDTNVVVSAIFKHGNHEYMSNFTIADKRHNDIVSMPWHVSNRRRVDFEKWEVTLGDNVHLKCVAVKEKRLSVVKVNNLSVKKFRWMLQACPEQCQIFQIFVNDEITGLKSKLIGYKTFDGMLQGYESLFWEILSDGVPPNWSMDHEILSATMPIVHIGHFQLSPEELKAAKEYVESLLKLGKIWPRKLTYKGTPFLLKEKNNRLRDFFDYRSE